MTKPMLVYAVIDDRSISNPLGDAIDTFVRREDAERFIARVKTRRPAARIVLADREAPA